MHCMASSAWKSIGSEPPTPTISASSITQPRGSSMGGSRQVTGSDEPGQERELQPLRRLDHLLGLGEAERKMLVVENRDRAAVVLEDLGGLAEELVARIEDLPLVVAGIIAVFADDQDGVDGQFVAAAAERLGNRGIDLEAEVAARWPLWSSLGFWST